MSKRLELSGKEFGRLTVGHALPSNKDGRGMWLCLCDCTNLVEVSSKSLVTGNTKSCGCLNREQQIANGKSNLKHGHAKSGDKKSTRTYNTWFSMKSRCNTLSDSTYYLYGAKGITYAPEWESFDTFLADMGERPEGKSLDRIDNNKGYSKDNCRWATSKEQVDNRKVTRKFERWGKMLTITDIALLYGIPRERVKYYLTEKMCTIDQMLEVLNG